MADRLVVRGAREHNLRDVSLDLPRDRLIVFTGLSGSGKSSLAFDTIYAEGQRRYVESLSAYARQFLGQMDKPDVDFIEGLSPAISIDQKSASRNPRSTVGTITEVYDYLRLLYARIGHPHCPTCGRPVARQTPQQIVDRVLELPEGTKFQVLAPVVHGRKGEYSTLLDDLAKQGFARVRIDGIPLELADRAETTLARYETAHDRGRRRPPRPARQRPPAPHRVHRDGPGADRRHGRGARHERDGRRRERRGHHLLPAPGLHPLRHQLRGAGPAQLLLQLALRRLPRLPRPRHALRGRPRARRARRHALVGRGCAGAVGRRPQRVLHRAPARRRRPRRLLLRQTLEVAQGKGQEARPLRDGRPGRARDLQEPLQPDPLLRGALRGHHPVAAAAPRRVRVGLVAASRSSSSCARSTAPSARAPASSPSRWPSRWGGATSTSCAASPSRPPSTPWRASSSPTAST